MTLARRPSPIGELLALRGAMDRIFDEPFFRPVLGTSEDARAMPMDIHMTAESLVMEAALPGVRPEDVEISILGHTLTLTATSRAETTTERAVVHLREIRRGRFRRTMALPTGLRTDAAKATFEHGILRLEMPRAEQAKPQRIPVTVPLETTAVAAETPAAGDATTAG